MKKLKRYTWSEYLALYEGHPIYYQEEFYNDMYDFLHAFAPSVYIDKKTPPKTVFGTMEYKIRLNADSIDAMLYDKAGYDEYETYPEGLEKIREFCEKWNKKYAQSSYMVDTTKEIIVPWEDFKYEK